MPKIQFRNQFQSRNHNTTNLVLMSSSGAVVTIFEAKASAHAAVIIPHMEINSEHRNSTYFAVPSFPHSSVRTYYLVTKLNATRSSSHSPPPPPPPPSSGGVASFSHACKGQNFKRGP